jgi:endonuclease III
MCQQMRLPGVDTFRRLRYHGAMQRESNLELATWIAGRLADRFPPPEWADGRSALDELVLTILSQNTSDVNSMRAFAALRRRYHDWDDVLAAEAQEVIEAIRPGGLALQKGPRIQNVLRQVRDRFGTLSLEDLSEWKTEDALAWLLSLKGVGEKTACIVLLFCFDRPVFPVDTHIERVSHRLGVVDSGASPHTIRLWWQLLGESSRLGPLHLHLIHLGRVWCRPARPLCSDCPLAPRCEHAAGRLSQEAVTIGPG